MAAFDYLILDCVVPTVVLGAAPDSIFIKSAQNESKISRKLWQIEVLLLYL